MRAVKLKWISAAVAAAMLIGFCGSASAREWPDVSTNTPVRVQTEEPVTVTPKVVTLKDKAVQQSAYYPDTVGWLYVPDTNINTLIVQRVDRFNNYYLKYNILGEPSKNGAFCADRRSNLRPGNREFLSRNTILYGHSWNDDPNGYLFSQLKRYQDPEFARTHPTIRFSTLDENLVWEVFAVSFCDVNLPYNRPDLGDEEHARVLRDIQSASIYNYDASPTLSDKLLTISTCTYSLPGSDKKLSSPNDYRFVIMAKLVKDNSQLPVEADFTINSSPRSANFLAEYPPPDDWQLYIS